MPDPLITLTTDFGDGSPYVAAMKGVILGINPWACLLDLSHRIPPQDLLQTDYFLRGVLPCYPPGAIHVIVVDPGVGSDRAILYVELAGHRLLVPDNGCWSGLDGAATARVRRLTERRFWRHPVSATFHGRDIFAPAAAHLSRGIDPAELGPEVAEWVALERPPTVFNLSRRSLHGRVQFVDAFGNLITNLSAQALFVLTRSPAAAQHKPDAQAREAGVPRWRVGLGTEGPDPAGGGERRTGQRHDWPALLRVRIGDVEVPHYVRTYAEAEAGSLVFLFSSDNLLEVAVVQGSAARRLAVEVGASVVVAIHDE